jgi:hypothetical protein
LREWADAKGVRDILHDEVERFRDYCLSGKNGKPVAYADYPAACRKWITNPNFSHGPRPLPRASPNGQQSNEQAKFTRSIAALQGVGGHRGPADLPEEHGETGRRALGRSYP